MNKFTKQQWSGLDLFLLLCAAASFVFVKGQEIPFIPSKSAAAAVAETPTPIKGWHTVSWIPGDQYEYGISNEVFYKKHNCAFIRSAAEPYMFGELSQTFKANQYRNKRMRFSAIIKSEVIDMSAALFMAVQGPDGRWLIYDEMYGRNIKSTRKV